MISEMCDTSNGRTCPKCGGLVLEAGQFQKCSDPGELRKRSGLPRNRGVGDFMQSQSHQYLGVDACSSGCGGTAQKMNGLGPDGCLAIFDELVDEMLRNLKRTKAETWRVWLLQRAPYQLRRLCVVRAFRRAINGAETLKAAPLAVELS